MLTRLFRYPFIKQARRTLAWEGNTCNIQLQVLRWLVETARDTEQGMACGYGDLSHLPDKDLYGRYAEAVIQCEYEDIRPKVVRMLKGEKNILWPGICNDFAQSSGTSGGKSKYVPITSHSLKINHYGGGSDAVGFYLNLVPESRLFDGKAFILGGSFANELPIARRNLHVGDLSATLIKKINPAANYVRVPKKRTALIADWSKKLPALVNQCCRADVTNLSGVPSWMLTVLRAMLKKSGADNVKDMWPNLEVFFHGGISFEPYKHEYDAIIGGENIRYLETYNASEGFFSAKNDFDDPSMLLLIDRGIFYEFVPLDGGKPLPAWEVEAGKIYELLISSCNGLWRYSPGDTVLVTSIDPVKITVAGRTKSFINAFGEELMEWNAEKAVGIAVRECGAEVANYTVAPIYAENGKKGRHQWILEWHKRPDDLNRFTLILDSALKEVNSDYQAKRQGNIFLDVPLITEVPEGTFYKWLHTVGNKKLGGQRKVPRLSNDRKIAEGILNLTR